MHLLLFCPPAICFLSCWVFLKKGIRLVQCPKEKANQPRIVHWFFCERRENKNNRFLSPLLYNRRERHWLPRRYGPNSGTKETRKELHVSASHFTAWFFKMNFELFLPFFFFFPRFNQHLWVISSPTAVLPKPHRPPEWRCSCHVPSSARGVQTKNQRFTIIKKKWSFKCRIPKSLRKESVLDISNPFFCLFPPQSTSRNMQQRRLWRSRKKGPATLHLKAPCLTSQKTKPRTWSCSNRRAPPIPPPPSFNPSQRLYLIS